EPIAGLTSRPVYRRSAPSAIGLGPTLVEERDELDQADGEERLDVPSLPASKARDVGSLTFLYAARPSPCGAAYKRVPCGAFGVSYRLQAYIPRSPRRVLPFTGLYPAEPSACPARYKSVLCGALRACAVYKSVPSFAGGGSREGAAGD